MSFQRGFSSAVDATVIFSAVSMPTPPSIYTIKYTSGVADYSPKYTLKYTSVGRDETSILYRIRSSYIYEDSVYEYRIRYTSGRVIEDYSDSYRIRYSVDNVREFSTHYRIRYNSEVVKQDIVVDYSIRYNTEYLTEILIPTFFVRYYSIGISNESYLKRYSINYTSQSLGVYSSTYKIKYNVATFYENFYQYKIRYTSETAEPTLVRAAVIKNNETTDIVFEVKGPKGSILSEYFFVFSNMPKYQLLEYTVGEEREFAFSTEDIEDVFIPEVFDGYDTLGYIVFKRVDINSQFSLDVYNIAEDYTKSNRAKSFFFDILDPESFTQTTQVIDGVRYLLKNNESSFYSYNNLNFTEVSVTPRFNIGSNCCFTKVINQNNNGGGACSPF